jgi:hypothetical protein
MTVPFSVVFSRPIPISLPFLCFGHLSMRVLVDAVHRLLISLPIRSIPKLAVIRLLVCRKILETNGQAVPSDEMLWQK